MKSFKRKKEELTKLKDSLDKARITIFTSFASIGQKGLNVGQARELKMRLREVDSEYSVSKKSLIDRAINNQEVDIFGMIKGSPGIVFGYGDEIAVAKSVYTFSRKNEPLKIFGALFGGKFIGGDKVVELAKFPSREVMLARTVGMIQYPLLGLVNVLRGSIRNLVLVLANIKK